jgi:hypothetical protein
MAQAQLIQVTDLQQLGASSDFLVQFQPRPLTVQIVAGGALGVMTWQWQQVGDSAFSSVISSEAQGGAAWSYSLSDPGFGVLTFPDGTYVINTTYLVSSTGSVTPGASAYAGLTATRFDARLLACIEVTSLAVTWMQPRVVPPVISVGQQIVGWLADIVMYRLRSRQGMTPPEAGAGDDNVRLRAKDAEAQLKAIGASADRPPDIVDSSQGDAGAGFAAYPIGDSLTGW